MRDFSFYIPKTGWKHSVEKREIFSHRQNISWNQVFSNFFSKNVTFTKFLPKDHLISRNFRVTTMWKISYLLSTAKYFVKHLCVISRNFGEGRWTQNCAISTLFSKIPWNQQFTLYIDFTKDFVLSHTMWIVEKWWIYCHAIFFSSIQLSTARFFSKMIIWQIFCEKTVALYFRNFRSVSYQSLWSQVLINREMNFLFVSSLVKSLIWRKNRDRDLVLWYSIKCM